MLARILWFFLGEPLFDSLFGTVQLQGYLGDRVSFLAHRARPLSHAPILSRRLCPGTGVSRVSAHAKEDALDARGRILDLRDSPGAGPSRRDCRKVARPEKIIVCAATSKSAARTATGYSSTRAETPGESASVSPVPSGGPERRRRRSWPRFWARSTAAPMLNPRPLPSGSTLSAIWTTPGPTSPPRPTAATNRSWNAILYPASATRSSRRLPPFISRPSWQTAWRGSAKPGMRSSPPRPCATSTGYSTGP